MRMSRQLRPPRTAGFTLVEALVAVGLTTIMLWGLLQLFTSATKFSSAVTIEAELCSAARAVLERMTRELSTASLRDGHDLKIVKSGGFDTVDFWAPCGADGSELVHIYYSTNSGSLQRKEGSDSYQPFGLTVERFDISYIEADGDEHSGNKTFSSELPLAVCIEIRVSDRKGMATVAMCSSAYLPGAGM